MVEKQRQSFIAPQIIVRFARVRASMLSKLKRWLFGRLCTEGRPTPSTTKGQEIKKDDALKVTYRDDLTNS